jgi:hypothetical protein
MAKKQQTADAPRYGTWGSYQLTDEQVRQAIQVFDNDFFNDTDDIKASMLLALLRSFTYAEDSVRENMLVTAEETLMPFTSAAHDALDRLAIKAHKTLIKERGVH